MLIVSMLISMNIAAAGAVDRKLLDIGDAGARALEPKCLSQNDSSAAARVT